MKHLYAKLSLSILAVLAVMCFGNKTIAMAAETNLIANPSAEQIDSQQINPVGWTQGNWGNNQVLFSLTDVGHTGIKALRIEVTGYQDGDAKWYFDKVPIQTGKYVFSDYYRSDTPTEVICVVEYGDNTTGYLYLGTLPANSDWTKSSFEFVAPENSSHLTIYHLISGNGFLETDDYLLTTPTSIVTEGNVGNASLEQTAVSDEGSPLGWKTSAWGNNNAIFDYLNTGHSGSKSVKTTMTNYIDGDAKWYPEVFNVTGNKTYIFSDYYQSDVPTEVIAEIEDNTGTAQYRWLGEVPASADWRKTSLRFDVPADTSKVTMFHLLNKIGYLTIDDFEVTEAISDEPIIITNNIPNSSLEQVSAETGNPLGWKQGGWGNHNVQYEYLDNGHTGTRAVKTTITNYIDGDAKWYPEKIEIPGITISVSGEQRSKLVFSDFYKADVPTEIIAAITHQDGTTTYEWLDSPIPSLDWRQTNIIFTVPTGITNLTIYHLINQNGFLITDDYSITAMPADEPIIITDNIPNNSLEQISASTGGPLGWKQGGWGSNQATFEYLDSGYSSSRSVKVTVANYVDGDAKWYPETVMVAGGKKYQFSNFYQSDIATEIIAAFTNLDGSTNYLFLGTLPASASWATTSLEIDVPTEISAMTIFHLVSSNGYLITDNFSLTIITVPIEQIVPNNSVEETVAGQNSPTGWRTDQWGNNTYQFEYLTSGHTGNRSLKTTISQYTDGDAKWATNPIAIEAGKTYRFTDYYQSDTNSYVILEITKTDGTVDHINLKMASPSAAWTHYSDVFTVPVNVTAISIFHLIASVGYIITDDYTLEPFQGTALDRPLLSLTFDDGWEGNVTSALPLLKQYGYKSTQYYATTFIENGTETEKIMQFVDAGHEIGSHSITHPNLTTLTDEQLDTELKNSKALLEQFAGVGNVVNFATPYGAYDGRVVTAILNYYGSHRSTDVGFNTHDGITTTNLRVQNMFSNTNLAEYQSWLDQAVRDKSWLILVYHRIADDPGTYDTYNNDFSTQLEAIRQSGITVLTVKDALAEILA